VLFRSIKSRKDEIKSLHIKKDSIKDKVEMQENFIDELENRSKENIENRKLKINNLLTENESYITQNSKIEEKIVTRTEDQEKVTGATGKLKKFGNLKF
jgi:hypothetical protein